jgi:hypothetical protein
MIAPLRRTHRTTFAALTIGLPLLLIAGLRSRPPQPAIDTLPIQQVGPGSLDRLVSIERSWNGLRFLFSILEDDSSTTEKGPLEERSHHLEIQPLSPLVFPDLLVYWTSETATAFTTLPDSALLLGTVPASRAGHYRLPPASSQGMTFILYSLGHGEVVGSLSVSTDALDRGGGR